MKGAGPFIIEACPPPYALGVIKPGEWRVMSRWMSRKERDAKFETLRATLGWEYRATDCAPCKCNCGYTCMTNGRRTCGLEIMECIEKHYVADCGHKWDGPSWESEDGREFSTTCSLCGMTAMGHDMLCGP